MDLVNSLSNSMNEKCGIIKKRELDVLDDSLAKWSPMASEINRDEFLGISFSHHMEILHKTKNIEEVLFCIHEAVVHQWDKYTLRDILKAGIPQQQLADKIGKKREYVAMLEKGETDMQLSTFIMISEAVGLKFALTY